MLPPKDYKVLSSYKTNNINDLELVYTALRAEYPDNQVHIIFDYNTKEYTVDLSDKPYKQDPEVPVDVSVQVVYGDSVTGDTPLVLRNPETKQVCIKTIDSLCQEWNEYPEFKLFDTSVRLEKQYSTTEYEVWSDQGWNPIKKVIRHKTDKKIYRVSTGLGIVDVTEDHSLCTPDYQKIKPKDVVVGQALLHSFPETEDYILNIGSLARSQNANKKFHISNQLDAQKEYLRLKNIYKRVYLDIEDSYYILSASDKTHTCGTHAMKSIRVKSIEMISEPDTSRFVYDLETENGRFNAGVGQMTISNTDSVFVLFHYNRDNFEKNRIDTFKLATICGDKLTNEVFNRPPIVMEFEKIFQPFILLTKKRYIAKKYEDPRNPFKLKYIDAKGIALTRRDYCKMVKDCYTDVIDTIMDPDNTGLAQGVRSAEMDPKAIVKKSIEVFKGYIMKIDAYDINVDDLVVSAMLAKEYKTKPVHVILAEKLKARKEQVSVGDRVPYIFIETDDPKKAKSELGEDPAYAKKNGLRYNRLCYLEQLAKPILGLYKVLLKDNESEMDTLVNYVNEYIIKYGGKKMKPSDFKMEE